MTMATEPTTRTIVWIDATEQTSSAQLGGKLGSLAEMTAAGFDVPIAFGVTTEAFRVFAAEAGLAERIAAIRAGLDTSDVAAVERAADEIARAIDAAPMPAQVEADVRAAYAELERRCGTPGVPAAVRSSGVSEDLEGASFAGQYDTYLWICGADDVLAHVRRCWSGLFNPAVLTYRPVEDLDTTAAQELPGMCVGVQRMVDATAAGVMFTLNPIDGDRSKIVIEACWGLGEGVVKGDVTPDRFKVDKVTLDVIEEEIGAQAQEYRFDAAAREVGLLDVDPERGASACLTPAQVRALAELAKRIERHRRAPMDMEWAVDQHGEVHLLQARPETVWASRPAPTAAGQGEGRAVDRVLAKFMRFGAARG